MRTIVLFTTAAALAACSIDESGLETMDAGMDVTACQTLDAACLGPLPMGWQPVSLTDAGCKIGFTRTTLVMNPRVLPNGCACGACEVLGSYACDAGVRISGGNTCMDTPIATATPGHCTAVPPTQHLEAYPIQGSGTVGCFAPNDAGAGATGDTVDLCVPGCTANYCEGQSRCIITEGDVACPGGFALWGHAGTGVDPGCAPCACDAGPPGACEGTVTAYQTMDCADSGLVHTYDAGTCNVFDNSVQYSSVFVALTPPATTCSVPPGPPDPGDASLVQPRTICCK